MLVGQFFSWESRNMDEPFQNSTIRNGIRAVLIIIVIFQSPNLLSMLFDSFSTKGSEPYEISEVQLFQGINFSDNALVDKVASQCMRSLHDKVDNDDDGNISPDEGFNFIKDGDFKKQSGKNLPGFETDKDGNITIGEFWDSWENSAVHNWTVEKMVEWFNNDLNMPHLTAKLRRYHISGSALPLLATNKSLVAAFTEKSKHSLRLQFKALELILGYTPRHSVLKDVLVTISLLLACSGIMFAYHVQKKSADAMKAMQDRLKSLQDQYDEEGITWMNISGAGNGSSIPHKDCDEHSLDSDTSLHTQIEDLQEELSKTKSCLEKAEEQLKLNNDNYIPPKLIVYLKETFSMELKHLNTQRSDAKNRVEKARSQFLKVNKKWGMFNSVPLISSRQTDKFDGEVDQASDSLKQFNLNARDFRRRWQKIEGVCKHRFITTATTTTSSLGGAVDNRHQQQQSAGSLSSSSSLQLHHELELEVSSTATATTSNAVVGAGQQRNGMEKLKTTSSPTLSRHFANANNQDNQEVVTKQQTESTTQVATTRTTTTTAATNNNRMQYSASKSLIPNSATEEEFKLVEAATTTKMAALKSITDPPHHTTTISSSIPTPKISSQTYPRSDRSPKNKHRQTSDPQLISKHSRLTPPTTRQISEPRDRSLTEHSTYVTSSSTTTNGRSEKELSRSKSNVENLKTAHSLPDFHKATVLPLAAARKVENGGSSPVESTTDTASTNGEGEKGGKHKKTNAVRKIFKFKTKSKN